MPKFKPDKNWSVEVPMHHKHEAGVNVLIIVILTRKKYIYREREWRIYELIYLREQGSKVCVWVPHTNFNDTRCSVVALGGGGGGGGGRGRGREMVGIK